MLHIEDKRLALPEGRTLAYADNGNTSSSTIILFLHGGFGVGDASRPSPVLLEKNFHIIAPTLPGWGSSSPVPVPSSYASTLAADITALITHLHPKIPHLKLYICGHSFGATAAQILYGASFENFPLGRQVAGLILLAPHSPPHCHKGYAKCMTWQGYFLAGPPTRYVPFNLVGRLAQYVFASKLKSEDTARVFVRSTLFDQMGDEEHEACVRWREAHGVEEDQLEREMAGNIVRSVAKTWQGFLDIPDIYHSGWGGFSPESLDEEHARRPVLVVSSRGDQVAPGAMAEWIVANYKNARLKSIEGGHMSSIFHLDEIWKEFLD